MSKISVIIPCFNAQDSIEATLKSVMDQTYSDFDVIVVDDGSTDSSIMKVWEMRELLNERNIVLHIISQKNSGVSAARNRGVQESTAQYIAFLDADDRWDCDKLTEHAAFMQDNPDVGISFARVRLFNSALDEEQKKATSTISSLPVGEQSLRSVFAENPTTTTSNLVVSRRVFDQVGGFNEQMSFAEDQEFIVRVLSQTQNRVVGMESVLTDYHISIDGLSSDLMQMYKGWLQMVDSVKSYDAEFVAAELDQAKALYCRYLARRSLRVNADPALGCYFCWQSFRHDRSIFLREPLRTVPVVGLSLFRCLLPRSLGEHLMRWVNNALDNKMHMLTTVQSK